MPLAQLARHVDYVAQRIGVDHVALGSDFDGAQMPVDLPDAAAMPRLVESLQAFGYDGEALRKITCDNWLRILRQSLK
jgi:membrane dipeptidase